MNAQEPLIEKLRALDRYLVELERLRRYSFEEVRASLQRTWAIEHGLQLAIQIVIDIGSHLLAALGERDVQDYTDVIEKLGEYRILPPEFASTIRGMAGFRNILVHEYVAVDVSEVYRVLQERLGDFREFARYVSAYIRAEPTS